MSTSFRYLQALALLTLVAGPALADEGELYIDATIGANGAVLANPWAGAALPFTEESAYAVLPELGVGIRYGVTNTLHVGLGVRGAFFPSLVSPSAEISGFTGSLYADHLQVAAPLRATYRLDLGYDYTGTLELELGPALAWWHNTALVDPKTLDGSGLAARIPVELQDGWYFGAVAGAAVLFEARLFDVFVIAAGPYIGGSWLGGVNLTAGIIVRPSFVIGHPFL